MRSYAQRISEPWYGRGLIANVSDRLARFDPGWYARVPALGAVAATPFCAGFLLWPDPRIAMLSLAPAVFLNAISLAPLWAANQAIAPLRMRATAFGIIYLGISVLAGGLAPQLVGFFNDLLAPEFGEQAVRYSLFLIVVTNLWGAFHGFMAAHHLPGDLLETAGKIDKIPTVFHVARGKIDMTGEASFHVFLSHNHDDKPSVEILASKLRDDGLRPFLDKWHLIPGETWQKGLEDALNQSECTAVFIGPSGLAPWHHQEMQIVLNKAAETRDDYRVIPVLLPGAEPSHVDQFLALRTWVDFRDGLEDEISFKRLVCAVKGESPDDPNFSLPDEPAPFIGLRAFSSDKDVFFFGRDSEIERRRRSGARTRLSSWRGGGGHWMIAKLEKW